MDINTEKRKRGEGSIWRRKDGIWEGAFVIGIDEETDKKIRKSVIAPTQEECQKKLRKLIREIRKEQNMHKPKSTAERKGITLGEWIDKWYNLYCKPSIRSSTAATYEACIYTHVVPKIGDWELTKITTGNLDKYIADLLENGKVKDDGRGRGLSNEVVRKTHSLIQSALDRAVAEGLISNNPARKCEVPSRKNQKVDILTKDEMKRVLIQAKEDGCYELLLLDLTTGLRRGELLGLKWEDIDFNARELSVKREAVLIKGKLSITPLKTRSAYRTIIMPNSICEMLKRYKETIDSEWVFPSPVKDDMPRDPSAVRKKLSNVLERANCKHVRFHALRHTFATMALQYGLDIKTLSSTIGHASVDVTIDTYSHVTDNMMAKAAARIDFTMGRNKGKEISRGARNENATSEKFEAYKGKKRKPGTGYVKQISENCWQGRYTPTINGKRVARNIYASTEEECEAKLAEMIREIKEEIKQQKQGNALIMA